MRILAVDFGEKRIGVAVSDETGAIVIPAGVIERKSDLQAATQITAMALEREIAGLVVGLPVKEDGSEGPSALRARSFARKLSEVSGLPVDLHNESGTTVEARERLRESGYPPGVGIDAMAAAVMLEDFLSTRPPS